MPRVVKTENAADEGEAEQGVPERRALRSRYLALRNLINDDRDEIYNVDSEKFESIINEVESLHKSVRKPREQVADAEALLGITNSFVTSVKAHTNEGVTPSNFISLLLENFGEQDVMSSSQDRNPTISWNKLGLSVSHIFSNVPGCCTMLGPMNIELKQRKEYVPRKRHGPVSASARPQELQDNGTDKTADTDKIMSTMFEILRKHRRVGLETLVLNRKSFAQTVENIFALSFLVKDGRVAMLVEEDGTHIISPRNAPDAAAVSSGQVVFSHFVFRFDFKDWKVMADKVPEGCEHMPHRSPSGTSSPTQQEQVLVENRRAQVSTPIKKLSRNRGLVTQEQAVGGDSSGDDASETVNSPRKKKRPLHGN